jgi:hypothetical protein
VEYGHVHKKIRNLIHDPAFADKVFDVFVNFVR